MKTIAQQLNIKDFPFEIKDKEGRLIYEELGSDGFWAKYEYGSDGYQKYYQDSTGCWRKWEHDSNGNVIYTESSSGYWAKYEYDSEGNVIYYEDSYGEIYDDRPKDEIIIDGIKYKRIEE